MLALFNEENIQKAYGKEKYDEGVAIGEAKGVEKATMEMARTLYEKKMPVEFIADCVKKPVEVVRSWLGIKPVNA